MMHEVAFCEFARKPKNFPPLGLDVGSATNEFETRRKDPEALIDYDGPTEKHCQRLGVKVKTLVAFRNAVVEERGLSRIHI
eukprot:12150832-Alexandrium_andersonii.AAC.1